MSPDVFRSLVRTYVPLAIGFLATLLVEYVAERFGIQIDGELAFALVYGATTALLYSLARWLESRRWAPARFAGRFLLSLGADLGKPTYQPKPKPPARMTAEPDRRHRL